MRLRSAARSAILVAAIIIAPGLPRAAEIRVFSTPTLKALLDRIAPTLLAQSGHTIVAEYDTAANLTKEIEASLKIDVALLLPDQIDRLIEKGKLTPARRDIARAAMGIAMKSTAPKPDLSTPDAFKRVLLAANTIAYTPNSASSTYMLTLIAGLGIEDAVKDKLRAQTGAQAMERIARGEVDLMVISVPNILGVPGVQLAGLLPEAFQNYVVYSAAMSPEAHQAEATALIDLLSSPVARAEMRSRGLEPLPK
ncbi:MAG: substrate-binding domain-containing protein [Beijerinckiaceae bacterium]|nr:substrate-binding domain-containing protein [Beijerinckiaceae bacterium]